ncbi:MAG: sigma-70 family RNA polymerase sigma factor [Planctomycetota bacterium]|jgi:RNA polymerase sigma-70 factor (ECF subfamily)|nr:sigma-70 family RNA polymerase sigma factor [Planctomycetota bacterium]
MEVDDEELMRRFQQGDPDAFDLLVHRHLDFVIRHARRYLRDLAGAEDVAQVVFLRVWNSRDRFRESISFRGWIAKITTRIALNEIRTRKRKRWTPRSALSSDPDAVVGSDWVGGSIRSKDPAQELLGKEKAKAVRDAIERLEEPGRQAIWLQNFEDWSVVRIAESLGMTVSATKSVLFRARKALLIDLNDYLDDTREDRS